MRSTLSSVSKLYNSEQVKKINEVSYYIDNSLISIFKKLCNDSTIKLTNQKGEIRVSFQK